MEVHIDSPFLFLTKKYIATWTTFFHSNQLDEGNYSYLYPNKFSYFLASWIIMTEGPLGLCLFWVYAKQIMQINKLLSIILKFVNVVHENTIFIIENLQINIKT